MRNRIITGISYSFIKKDNSTPTFVLLEKEIDFIPSVGLEIRVPFIGKIKSVFYDENGYTSIIDTISTTDPENQVKYLKSIGFKESQYPKW